MLPKEKGLSEFEAKEKLKQFGPNVLPEKPPPSDILIFVSQFKNPLVYLLVFAGVATLFLSHFSDAAIIAVAIFINTVLGFFQERRASHALHALKKLVEHKTQVIRDGRITTVDSESLVPGDVVVLSPGSKVPADGFALEPNRFSVTEAVLTGESLPVFKKDKDKLFMGTIVNSGRAFMRVEVTGEGTEIGKIALKVQGPEEETPLKKQIKIFSRQLSFLVVGLTVLVIVVGLLTGKEFTEILITSIALAVSAVPEGLLVGLTVVLAIGMQRILSKKGLVRKLISAETLGGVTTICIDKTGTLTEGKLKVTEVLGNESEIVMQAILANDLDDPLLVAAFEWAGNLKQQVSKDGVDSLRRLHPRLDAIPFSPKERFFAALNKWKGSTSMLFVNGAPEYLLEWCRISLEEKKEVLEEIKVLSSQGKRLIGLARKKIERGKRKILESEVKNNLEWVGIIAFWDPVRAGVREALEKTKTAGIRLIVITGDYPETAVSVMKKLSLLPLKNEVITGASLEKMSSRKLAGEISHIKLFARTSPDLKEKIVEALKLKGEVVAMMGDGVNDAPALNRADIGIVVGNATDVARESADLVLLDSNFATVISAIEEGRGIFDNLRKIILYLLSDAFGEIVTVVGAMVVGLPLPVTAVQILWINLISDGFPDLALTVDPKREGIMNGPPRNSKETLITGWMKTVIASVSITSGVLALGFFAYVYRSENNYELARSVAFLTLGINSLVYVFSVKNLTDPFWKGNMFNNNWLIVAVAGGVFLQIIPFMTASTRGFFGTVPLPANYWAVAILLSSMMFIMVELSKFIFSLFPKWQSS